MSGIPDIASDCSNGRRRAYLVDETSPLPVVQPAREGWSGMARPVPPAPPRD
ncbi:hypothetical protein [Arthrobacter nitrophenolicus]|uniref:Uncharacterized protein n=1 Tax=Arthrobacter nitrophenolicus TaxID=683150 RepID=A0ACC6TJJ4_9MICC